MRASAANAAPRYESALRENHSDESPRLSMKGFLEVHFEKMTRVTEVRLGCQACHLSNWIKATMSAA